MHYSSIMGGSNLKQIIVLLVLLFQGCDRQKNNEIVDNVIREKVKISDFKEYFSIDTYDEEFVLEYNYILQINSELGFYNNINSITDIEIRILSYKDFEESYYYRLIYTNDKWEGKLYVLEGITNQIIKESDFTPILGWKVFEKSIVDNDVLNLDGLKFESNALHPRFYTLQIITPFSMKIIPLKDFYNVEENSTSNYSNIKNIVDLIINNG